MGVVAPGEKNIYMSVMLIYASSSCDCIVERRSFSTWV